MNRTISTFLTLLVMTAALTALSIALTQKGYGFGTLGLGRLDGLAGAATFVPLAALYALAGVLMVILPLRAAGWVHANGATPLFLASVLLLASIVGVQLARLAFGDRSALLGLADWQFVFAAGIVAAHLAIDTLRRNVLLRTIAFAAFVAASLACLYWTFRF